MNSGDYGLHLKLITQDVADDGTISYGAYGLFFSAK
jgi:hypothetical protein